MYMSGQQLTGARPSKTSTDAAVYCESFTRPNLNNCRFLQISLPIFWAAGTRQKYFSTESIYFQMFFQEQERFSECKAMFKILILQTNLGFFTE